MLSLIRLAGEPPSNMSGVINIMSSIEHPWERSSIIAIIIINIIIIIDDYKPPLGSFSVLFMCQHTNYFGTISLRVLYNPKLGI
jgi:hypothetical protein